MSSFGCGAGDRAPTVERVDSAGVQLVLSGAADRPLAWTPDPLFTLGGEESGPESFYRVGDVWVGADLDGRIHILDLDAHRVVVFDADGAFLHAVGGAGGGPGELERPGPLSVTPDGIVSVFDYGKGALVRWDSAGNLLPQIRFPHFPMIGGRHHRLLPDGYLVSSGGLDETGERANRLLRVLGEDTTVLASIPQPGRSEPAIFESCGGGINFPPLFTPHVIWDHRGDLTAVVPGDAYRIDLYRGRALVRSVRRSILPGEGTREAAIKEAGEGFRIDFGRGPCLVPPDEYAEARGWAATIPAISDVALRPGGGLWVQRRVPGEDDPPIDVFSDDGAYVGTLPAGTRFPALHLPNGRFGLVAVDEMDVGRLEVVEVSGGPLVPDVRDPGGP
ncbi:MAG TPA: 6-bladed beta-propeller [Longimicrobiales bacterium]|nr:6-bladed beta-propeller [Longimicrobiales bacterium]